MTWSRPTRYLGHALERRDEGVRVVSPSGELVVVVATMAQARAVVDAREGR